MRVSGAPVRRPGRAVGPPLCWEASGGEIPRWAPAADSRFPRPRVALSPAPRGGARPPRLHRPFRGVGLAWPHPVGALLRLSVRLSPLAVCRSPGPRPGVSRFPGPPRSRSAARFAAACPPPPSRAGRGGALVIFPPPRPPAQVRSPERGSGPRSCPPRAGRRVLAGRHPPPLWGGCDGRTPRARVGRPRCGLGRGSPPAPPPSGGGWRAGSRRCGRCGGGGRGGSAALSLSLLAPPRGGGGALRPSWTESVRAIGRPRRGAGRGRSGLPAGRAPSRHRPPPSPPAPSPRGPSGSPAAARVSRPGPLSPACPARPAPRARFPYLVDPASSICLSQRLSHACLSTHGRYSETANGSLNQLWFLWSLAPLLLG